MNRNLSSLSDAELLSQFKATQKLEVLSELFIRYTSLLHGVCLKYLKDREEAKDMVMQVYEKLPTKLSSHEVTYFKSWIYITTRNECLMYLRTKKSRLGKEIDSSLMENELILHQEEEPEIETNLTKLEHCISQLIEDQKECVHLFFMQEKCYKDITGITGFNLNKVKSHIQNGKRNLKICMEKNAGLE